MNQDRSITCRNALPSDAPTLIRFQVEMALETEGLRLDPDTCSRGVRAVFERPELGVYFVAEQGGAVVASLLVTFEWSDWRNGMVWWIQSVYVEPITRQHGAFRALYTHIKEKVAADPALRGLRLYVDRRNTRAQQVYEAIGMDGNHYLLFEWMK